MQGAANDRGPGGDHNQRVLRAAGAKGEHAGDHGNVPKDGRGVGKKKFAVAIEHAEAPGGGDKQTGTGEENADEENGEFALFTVKAGGDGINEPRRGENTEQDERARY